MHVWIFNNYHISLHISNYHAMCNWAVVLLQIIIIDQNYGKKQGNKSIPNKLTYRRQLWWYQI